MTNANDLIYADGNYKELESEKQYYPQHGLTKREYFAAMAMQGLIANNSSSYISTLEDRIRYTSKLAVEYSDFLIKQLNNQ